MKDSVVLKHAGLLTQD